MRLPPSGALNDLTNEIPRNATWNEDIFFTDDTGDPYDISALDFEITLRKCVEQDNADLTLSITNGKLSIETDSTSGEDCILRIAAGEPTTLCAGDYICDISMQDDDDVITLVASGVVTVTNNPVAWG